MADNRLDFSTKVYVIVTILSLFGCATNDAQNVDNNARSNFNLFNATKDDYLTFVNYTQKRDDDDSIKYGLSAAISGDVRMLTMAVEMLENSQCKNHSLNTLKGLLAGNEWALKMYDASAKSSNGLLYGTSFQLGNFDECLSIGEDNQEKDDLIGAQYCLANIQLRKKNPANTDVKSRLGPRDDVHWAICVPKTCTAEHVTNFFVNLLTSSGNNAKVSIPELNCYKSTPIKVNTLDIIFGVFIVGFTSLLISCTGYHLYVYIRDKTVDKQTRSVTESLILSFSIVENLKKIFTLKQQNELGLDAIAGVRSLSMILILIGHALIFIVGGPVMNTKDFDDMIIAPENSFVSNSTIYVDTFLFLSAFLFARLIMSELDKRRGKVNFVLIFIFRYIRVTSAYVVVMLFYMTWFDKIGTGPLWRIKVENEKNRCLESWWTNLLYVNNYVNTDKLCMFQSWYVSVDTQLFLFAPFIMFPLWKWRRLGEAFLLLVTFITSIIPFIITYQYSLDATIMPFSKEVFDISINEYFVSIYTKTHTKAVVYCIGLAYGYVLYRIQTSMYKLPKYLVIFGWIMSISIGITILFSVSIFRHPNYQYDALEAAAYNSLHHVGWALSTGWLLIACATGNAGIIKTVFSWKPFIPISRLTYCAYLINGVVELYNQGILRSPFYISKYTLVSATAMHVLQTFIGALVLCVMFESPLHGIEKILLKRFGATKKDDSKDYPNGMHKQNT